MESVLIEINRKIAEMRLSAREKSASGTLTGEVSLHTLRTAKSCLNDAWQACDRAERALRRYRKNVWWTTWFFELQMKLAELDVFWELKVWINEGNEDTPRHPLPHLGPESTAYAVPTLIERLLDNAERMVRFDLFRLARVVESFANSLLVALLWTQQMAPGQVRGFLAGRVKLLCRRLKEAEFKLKRHKQWRDEADSRSKGTRAGDSSKKGIQLSTAPFAEQCDPGDTFIDMELDPNVSKYVDMVLDTCDRVCQCVSVYRYVSPPRE